MIMTMLLPLITSAHAYEFIEYNADRGGPCARSDEITWSGSSASFWIQSGTFMDNYGTQVMVGVKAWNAGPGTVNRGADWEFSKAGDAVAVLGADNGYNEIYAASTTAIKSSYGLDSSDWWAYTAVWADEDCEEILEADIIFDQNLSWSNGLPSTGNPFLTPPANIAVGAVAEHEAGHALGLDHDKDNMGVMFRWAFAEHGSEIRLSEDDYNALTYLHPLASNTGKNFMITPWVGVAGSSQRTYSLNYGAVDVGSWATNVCGTVPLALGPPEILSIVNGTAANYTNIPMEWTISSDSTCFNADDITIGTRTPSMTTNIPFPVGPVNDEYIIPSNTADGDYWVCVGINPDENLGEAESSYSDNVIRSGDKWTIDCP